MDGQDDRSMVIAAGGNSMDGGIIAKLACLKYSTAQFHPKSTAADGSTLFCLSTIIIL
jgi:hypothetical protein